MPLPTIETLEQLFDHYGHHTFLEDMVDKLGVPSDETAKAWAYAYHIQTDRLTKPQMPTLPEHHAHVSEEDPDKITFFAKPADLTRGVTTTMKPGRYLTKYMKDQFSEQEIKTKAQEHINYFKPPELKYATTMDEIERVYETGPKSCMQRGRGHLPKGIEHPARTYESPDLAIAYVEHRGTISARAVVNTRDKKYVRVYGENTLLQPLLTKEGYRCTSDALNNCRITRIPATHPEYNDPVLAPYLDGDVRNAMVDPEEPTRYIRLNQTVGPVMQTTSAVVDLPLRQKVTCSCCGTSTYVEETITLEQFSGPVCRTCESEMIDVLNGRAETTRAHPSTAVQVRHGVWYLNTDAARSNGWTQVSHPLLGIIWETTDDIYDCPIGGSNVSPRTAQHLGGGQYARTTEISARYHKITVDPHAPAGWPSRYYCHGRSAATLACGDYALLPHLVKALIQSYAWTTSTSPRAIATSLTALFGTEYAPDELLVTAILATLDLNADTSAEATDLYALSA